MKKYKQGYIKLVKKIATLKVYAYYYYGYLQGHIVIDNNKKYPIQRGSHYTSMSTKQAINYYCNNLV